MSLQSFNRVLFRCDSEEHDDYGSGAYNIPNFGSFVYCGLQGGFLIIFTEKDGVG